MTKRSFRSPKTGVYARILDVPVSVTGLPSALAAGLRELLTPFLAKPDPGATSFRVREEGGAPAVTWSVYEADRRLARFTDAHELLAHLEWRVAATALEASHDRIPYHAAALTRNNQVLLMIGESGAGKTTLTLGLMARGWEPFADDIAVIETATLIMQQFPRCFHVDETTRSLTAPAPILDCSSALPGYSRPRQWAREGLRPTALVLVGRDPQRPSALSPILQAEAAGGLLQAAIHNQVPLADVARMSVRIAAHLSWCGSLNNAQLTASLDLLESI